MNNLIDRLLTHASIEIYIAEAQSLTLLYLNEAAEKHLGYHKDELIGKPLATICSNHSNDELKNIFQPLLQQDSDTPPLIVNAIHKRKDGSSYPAEVTLQAVSYQGQNAYAGLVQNTSSKIKVINQLSTVLAATSTGFFDWNLETHNFHVDNHWNQLHGCKQRPQDITLEAIQKLVHKSDVERVSNTMLEAIKSDKEFHIDFRSSQHSAQPIWLRSTGAVVSRDSRTGEPIRVSGITQDITAQKQNEIEKEEYYKFFQISTDLMVIGHLSGALLKVNQATLDATGFTEAEMLAMSMQDWVHPEDREKSLEEQKRLMKIGRTFNFENRCRCKDGTYRWLSWRASYNLEDQTTYATARDITESKRIEEELLKQQRLFLSLVENTEDVISHYDRNFRHTYVNPSIGQLSELLPEDYIGKSRREMGFSPELCDLWEEALGLVFETGKAQSRQFYSYNKHVEGATRIAWNAFPGLIEDGEVKSVFAISRDITHYIQVEEELQKMHKLNSLGVLAGGIAHDFNNILTVLFGNIELARSMIPHDHKSQEKLEQASRAFQRATHLTSQLLTFAKGGDPVKQDVSIGSLVEEVVQFDLSGSNVKLVLTAPNNLWKACVDKGQISQVFSNLATNANQAMPDGGHLAICIRNTILREGDVAGLGKGHYLEFIVKDEGTGIKKTDLDKIFDPYFSTKQQGSGLGLATVYSIVQKHGGHIAVDSRLNEGTTFTLYLPASLKRKNQEEISEALESQQAARALSILVMDDEKMICELTKTFLSSKGYKVDSAENGEEAITLYKQAILNKNPYDCVLMDLTIPGGVGGKEAISEILKLDPLARGIVSSGYAADPVMANFGDYGFKGCINKPFFMGSLLTEIQRVLNDEEEADL